MQPPLRSTRPLFSSRRQAPAAAGRGATGLRMSPPATTPLPPTPTTRGAQQTESANPLTGTSNDLPTGRSQDITPPAAVGKTAAIAGAAVSPPVDPGRSMGVALRPVTAPIQRGDDIPADGDQPASTDAASAPAPVAPLPDEEKKHVGGTGAYARKFSNPVSASIYHDFVTKAMGADAGAAKTNQDQT